MKKVYLFLIIPVLSLCLFGCENKELKEKYDHGVKLIENKEWERATTVFKDLGDYKDSKDKLNEIIFLSSTETIDEHIDYPGLYGDDIKKGIKNLLSILKYKNTKSKVDEYYNKIIGKLDDEKNVPNSEQKDYSGNFYEYLEILEEYAYNDNYKSQAKPKVCDYSIVAFNEGFINYTFSSNIEFHCEDSSFVTNNKYYKMTNHSWSGTRDVNRYSSYDYFVQFLTTNVMTYEETYISIYGTVPIQDSYWYKIIDDAIYVKKNRKEKYEKKFVITTLNDTTLKFKGYNYTLNVM